MDEVIRVEGLTKNFGPLKVLRGIDCSVSASEVVCVIGPSGSGKSTFLRCLNGLEEASGGRVLVRGVSVHDNATEVLRHANVYISNRERNALFKGGARGAMVNNLVFNPGRLAVHDNLWPQEWGDKPW